MFFKPQSSPEWSGGMPRRSEMMDSHPMGQYPPPVERYQYLPTGHIYQDRHSYSPVPYLRQAQRRLPDPNETDPAMPGQNRKRIAVACARCRKRKIKCSGDKGDGQGCDSCKTAGTETCNFYRVGSKDPKEFKDFKSFHDHKPPPNAPMLVSNRPGTVGTHAYAHASAPNLIHHQTHAYAPPPSPYTSHLRSTGGWPQPASRQMQQAWIPDNYDSDHTVSPVESFPPTPQSIHSTESYHTPYVLPDLSRPSWSTTVPYRPASITQSSFAPYTDTEDVSGIDQYSLPVSRPLIIPSYVSGGPAVGDRHLPLPTRRHPAENRSDIIQRTSTLTINTNQTCGPNWSYPGRISQALGSNAAESSLPTPTSDELLSGSDYGSSSASSSTTTVDTIAYSSAGCTNMSLQKDDREIEYKPMGLVEQETQGTYHCVETPKPDYSLIHHQAGQAATGSISSVSSRGTSQSHISHETSGSDSSATTVSSTASDHNGEAFNSQDSYDSPHRKETYVPISEPIQASLSNGRRYVPLVYECQPIPPMPLTSATRNSFDSNPTQGTVSDMHHGPSSASKNSQYNM